MKTKAIYLLSIISACLLLDSCIGYLGPTYRRQTHILGFYTRPKIDMTVTDDVEVDGNLYSQVDIWLKRATTISRAYPQGDYKRKDHRELCTKYNDGTKDNPYPKGERISSITYGRAYLYASITDITVKTVDIWNEAYGTQSELNEICYLTGVTAYPYINSGYKEWSGASDDLSGFFKISEQYYDSNSTEDYPVDKPLKDVESDDLKLTGYGEMMYHALFHLFIPKPEDGQPKKLEITLKYDSGVTYTHYVVVN